jgi:peptidoglycan/xylan/chitin deacetylase (PgdA/CDA1 family)
VIVRFLLISLLFLSFWTLPQEGESKISPDYSPAGSTPIFVYHRFGPTVSDSMTITTSVFESHIQSFMENGFQVVALRDLVAGSSQRTSLSSRQIAITIDDGHKTVYTEALPIIKKYRIPVTLFLYPSNLSNASYAMTWEQLGEMKATGLVDFQSHTYWHPNFKKDKDRLRPTDYEKFVEIQLKKSKETLEKHLQLKVDMLAWPFGIYDSWLMAKAADAGYVAAFTIDRHHASSSDHPMALPRYLITNGDQGKVLENILSGFSANKKI